MAKGPNIPLALHKGDKESVGYLMAQEKTAKDTQALAEAAATSTDLAALDARVTVLENPASDTFTSSDQSLVGVQKTTVTIPHGLGATPTKLWAYLVCQSADANYAPPDIIPVATFVTLYTPAGAASVKCLGCNIMPDATNLNIAFAEGSSATVQFLTADKSTWVLNNLLNTNWKLRVIASL